MGKGHTRIPPWWGWVRAASEPPPDRSAREVAALWTQDADCGDRPKSTRLDVLARPCWMGSKLLFAKVLLDKSAGWESNPLITVLQTVPLTVWVPARISARGSRAGLVDGATTTDHGFNRVRVERRTAAGDNRFPFASIRRIRGWTGRETERAGFEPAVELPLHLFSRQAPSTTRTPLPVSISLPHRFCAWLGSLSILQLLFDGVKERSHEVAKEPV